MNPDIAGQLRDIHLPPAPGAWPPAPGWWGLALITLAAVAWIVRRRIRRRPLHAALRELDALAAGPSAGRDPVWTGQEISRVLRRYARWRFPQSGVAGLTGGAWLDFLDTHGDAGSFTGGPGALLETLPYRRPGTVATGVDTDVSALLALARRWLRSNAP